MKNFDYQKAKAELEDILLWFEAGDVSIDEAIAKHKEAEAIIKQLEDYLGETKLKIEKLANKNT